MSYRVKTHMPILDIESLINALNECGCKYTQISNGFRINGGYSSVNITLVGSGYVADHSDHDQSLVNRICNSYTRIYAEKMQRLEKEKQELLAKLEQQRQEEELRKEAERLAQIEAQKKAEQERLEKYKQEQKEKLIAKAKAQGYQIKEKKVGDKVQLVCVRYT